MFVGVRENDLFVGERESATFVAKHHFFVFVGDEIITCLYQQRDRRPRSAMLERSSCRSMSARRSRESSLH